MDRPPDGRPADLVVPGLMPFIQELKKRHVFKVGAAYAIVAWLLVQAADVFVPPLVKICFS